MSLLHSTSYTRNQKDGDSTAILDLTKMPLFRVGIVIHRVTDGHAARANNLYNYLDLNRRFLEQTTQGILTPSTNRSLIDAKAQVSADSLVGYSTSVNERASIKKSVIGKHCVIGKMVKIVGCLILDHCVIGDGAKIDGCILGKNVKVGERSELSRCVLQAGYEINPAGRHHNEKLNISEWATTPLHGGLDHSSSSDSDSD